MVSGRACPGGQLADLRVGRCGRSFAILKSCAVRRCLRGQAAGKTAVVGGQFAEDCDRLSRCVSQSHVANPWAHRRRMIRVAGEHLGHGLVPLRVHRITVGQRAEVVTQPCVVVELGACDERLHFDARQQRRSILCGSSCCESHQRETSEKRTGKDRSHDNHLSLEKLTNGLEIRAPRDAHNARKRQLERWIRVGERLAASDGPAAVRCARRHVQLGQVRDLRSTRRDGTPRRRAPPHGRSFRAGYPPAGRAQSPSIRRKSAGQRHRSQTRSST